MTKLITLLFLVLPTLACVESLEERSKEERYFEYFRIATRIYFEDCKKLPTSFSSLINNPKGCEKWGGPYIKDDISDSWGNLYVLELVGDTSVKIVSGGKDGIVGTSDDLRIIIKVDP